VILSLGALRWGVSRRGNDSDGRGWSRCRGYGRYRGYGRVIKTVLVNTFFGDALETWAILNRMVWRTAVHTEFVGGAAFSFLLG